MEQKFTFCSISKNSKQKEIRSNSSKYEETIENIPILPNNLKIPDIIYLTLLDGSFQECFIFCILEHIKDCLFYFKELQLKFINIPDLCHKIIFFESIKEKLYRETKLLTEELNLLSRIIQEPSLNENYTLIQYFTSCICIIQKAIEWKNQLENNILKQSSNNNEKSNIYSLLDIETKIQYFEKMVQELIENDNIHDQEKKKNIKKLYHDIQKNYQQYSKDKHSKESNISKLKFLLEFIEENFIYNSQQKITDQIEDFESSFYLLLEESYRINNENKFSEITKLKDKIELLMKNTSSLKPIIKNIFEDKQQIKDQLINRLEDLQGNIVDFEHSLNTKYHFLIHSNLKQEEYKNKKLKDAKKEHNKIMSELFEL